MTTGGETGVTTALGNVVRGASRERNGVTTGLGDGVELGDGGGLGAIVLVGVGA